MACSDDAAIAHEVRGLRVDGLAQQHMLLDVLGDVGVQSLQQWGVEALQRGAQRRQRAEAGAQLHQIARSRRAQCDAGQNALEIAYGAQPLAHRLEAPRVHQCRHSVIALAQQPLRAHGSCQRAPQCPRAHRGHGRVDDCEQRCRLIAREAVVELEIAARGGIQRQRVRSLLDLKCADVRQRRALRIAYVLQQRPGSALRQRAPRTDPLVE